MRPPRRLTPEETAIWRKVAETVTPLRPARRIEPRPVALAPPPPEPMPSVLETRPAERGRAPVPSAAARRSPPPRVAEERGGLDASWERKFAKGALEPDFSLDLHGAGLDAAYIRLMRGLTQARAMGARVVLVVTGKPRPVEAADRGKARGAIRAKIGDWLAASEHAADIAAIRGAHRRHGGQGALYVVLKRRR